MYHVFVSSYEYDPELASSQYKGHASTLEEAYALTGGRHEAELAEITDISSPIRFIASIGYDDEWLTPDHKRRLRRLGWIFEDKRPTYVVDEWTEVWVDPPNPHEFAKAVGFNATGGYPIGMWRRE